MSKTLGKFIAKDPNSLEADGDNLRVKVSGAIERTASGLNVKALSITDGMLAGSISLGKLADSANILLRNQTESITGKYNFPEGANAPTINSKEISTKEYVDSVAQGLRIKDPCKVLSNVNLDLDGVETIDGIGVVAEDRVLCINQTDPIENGIWVVKAGPWERPADFDTGDSASGAFTFIEQGATFQDTGWVCTTDKPNDVIDTNPLAFVQFSGAGLITAGNGLEKDGNTLNVLPGELIKGGDAEIEGDKIQIDYVPTHYTRSFTGTEGTALDQIVSHFKGISDAIGGIGQSWTDLFTLTGTDITNKYVDLTYTPVTATRVVLTVKGAPSQFYGDDYEMLVSPDNRLSWAGLGLDGELSAGDKLTVLYDITA